MRPTDGIHQYLPGSIQIRGKSPQCFIFIFFLNGQDRQNDGFYQRDAMLARYLLSQRAHPSVRLSVCRSQTGIVSKRQNLGCQKQRHTITPRL